MDEYTLPKLGDLSLVSIDDLITELFKRGDTVVVLIHTPDTSEERSKGTYSRHGCYFTAIGMLEAYKSDLLHFDLKNMPEEM